MIRFVTNTSGMMTIVTGRKNPIAAYGMHVHPEKLDTCFQNGLVMGIADCIFYAGLDKIL